MASALPKDWKEKLGVEVNLLSSLEQAKLSQEKWGGTLNDYWAIHSFLDSPGYFLTDERALINTHNNFGIWLALQIFGPLFKRESDGELIPTARLVKDHIQEELGMIYNVSSFLKQLPIKVWMNGLTQTQVRRMQALAKERAGALED